ncbi:hypothetical protein OAE74_02645, partial [Verrucomicrobia bacterium]|nr:hypothetical protein [Verrucomicrobiota bacterium]
MKEVIPIHIAIPVSDPNDVVLIGTELSIDMNGIQEPWIRRVRRIIVFQLIEGTWKKPGRPGYGTFDTLTGKLWFS